MYKFLFITILIICSLCQSCGHLKNPIDKKPEVPNTLLMRDSISKVFEPERKVFDVNLSDSTLLAFTNIKSFDTSSFLIVVRDKEVIKVKFLYYPPTYYKDFYNGEHSDFFIYKAINFHVQQNDWANLITKLQQIKAVKNGTSPNYLHPMDAKLFFDNKFYSTNEFDVKYFDQVIELFNTNLLNRAFSYYPVIDGKIP